MLRGIDAGKIQRQTEKELDAKYGGPVTSVEAARKRAGRAAGAGGAAGDTTGGATEGGAGGGATLGAAAAVGAGAGAGDAMGASVASVEGFLASAPEDHTGLKSDLNQYW